MSSPDPLTSNVPLENVASPGRPTTPMSLDNQPAGNDWFREYTMRLTRQLPGKNCSATNDTVATPEPLRVSVVVSVVAPIVCRSAPIKVIGAVMTADGASGGNETEPVKSNARLLRESMPPKRV